MNTADNALSDKYYSTDKDAFYCLYSRKDEKRDGIYKKREGSLFENNQQCVIKDKPFRPLPGWFILKPQPRKKKEILHPAKYPEELVEIFLNKFTNGNNNIIAPISVTGSTQLAALKNNRNTYGTELGYAEYERDRRLGKKN